MSIKRKIKTTGQTTTFNSETHETIEVLPIIVQDIQVENSLIVKETAIGAKGETGEQGIQGEKGDKGDAGGAIEFTPITLLDNQSTPQLLFSYPKSDKFTF